MADSPPQLGQMPYMNLSGVAYKSPRQPHLWQQALEQFMGGAANDVGKAALTGLTTPGMTFNNATHMTDIDKPNWLQHMTPEQLAMFGKGQADIAGTNAATNRTNLLAPKEGAKIDADTGLTTAQGKEVTAKTPGEVNLLGQEGRKTGAEADQTVAMTPALINEAMSRGGLNTAESDRITGMLPYEQAASAAGTGETGARANYMGQMANWFGPEAQSRIALQGAQQGLTGAQTGEAQHGTFAMTNPMTLLPTMGFDPTKDPQGYQKAAQAMQGVPLPSDGNYMNYLQQMRQAALSSKVPSTLSPTNPTNSMLNGAFLGQQPSQ